MSRRLPVLSRSLFVLFIFVLSFGQFSGPVYSAEQAPLVPCTGAIRIMPLGDSITQGSASGVTDPTLQTSYRRDLYNSLVASYGLGSVDFVGSLTNGDNVVPSFDPNHEGHTGWTAAQVAGSIYNWVDTLGADWPHIILLHIGTNTNGTVSPSENAAQVEDILDEIDRFERDNNSPITVILALIIDHEDHDQDVSDFNDLVATMAQDRINDLSDDIVIVDMETGANLNYELYTFGGDFYNLLHPWETGYEKMAAVWKTALDSVFGSCNHLPTITNPGNQTSTEGSGLSLTIQADPGEAGQTLTFSQTGLPPDLSIDPSTGIITGLISYDAAAGSPYTVQVTVKDNGFPAGTSWVTFSWTIQAALHHYLPMITASR